jgi:DNA-binding transcriptional LysR family regulator
VSHGLARLRRVLHDPLFLKHPKGVVPTDRASDLAGPVADILERVRAVLAHAEGFEAERSTRRFTIGAPDAVFAVVLPPLLAALAKLGPSVDLNVRPILPQSALADLDARRADLVIQPLVEIPPRFHAARLYEEEFAIAMRTGHPLGSKLTLGGLPAQDWSLRVTLVYSREGSEWRLVHRHADPLGAGPVSLTESAALARGERKTGG